MSEHLILYGTAGVLSVLIISSIVLYISTKIKLPFSILLVFIGILLHPIKSSVPALASIELTPEMLFYVFLPLLLFESTYNLNWRKFRKNLSVITLFATVGVLISAFIVAGLVHLFTGLNFGIALIFGTVIACTDPIAVIGIFKKLGVPKRLQHLLDGESMLNDGTAVIFSKIILSIIITGFTGSTILQGGFNLIFTILVSALTGFGFGWIASRVVKYIQHQMMIEITLTIVLALISFIIGEAVFHVSGIIATVVAGITFSIFGKDNFSSDVKHFANEIWEYISFLANSFVFLLVGMTFGAVELLNNWREILIVFVIVIFARSVSVYLLGYIHNKSSAKLKISTKWLHIINWGGLRGALPIAFLLSLEEFAKGGQLRQYMDTVITYTIGVVILSLTVNGLSIGWLIKKLKVNRPDIENRIHSDLIKVLLLNQSLDHINELNEDGEISNETKNILYNEKWQEKKAVLNNLSEINSKRRLKVKQVLYQYAFEIESSEFTRLYDSDVISEKIYNQLREKLEEGIDLINNAIFPAEFSRDKMMRVLSKKGKKNFTVEELYLYRKARQIANKKVIKELSPIKKIEIMKDLTQELLLTYNKFYNKNVKMCEDLLSQNPDKIMQYEDDLGHKEISKIL